MAVSNRTFGVEIECTYGAQPSGKSDVYERLPYRERDPMRARAVKELGAHKELKRWAENIGIDGSGIEIRSPVLKGQEGIEELAAVFAFLNEQGSTVTNQDGLHVHHGAEDFTKDWRKLYYVCASWGKWTPQIHSMVASRRRNGGMCPDAFNSADTLKSLEAVCMKDKEAQAEAERLYQEYQAALARYYRGGPRPVGKVPGNVRSPAHLGGRGAFNLGNLERVNGKTIEIRLAEGLMDGDAAVAWVKFGQRFLDHAAEAEEVIDGKPKNLDTLLAAIKLDEDAAAVLKAKAANKGNALVKAAPGKTADGVNFNAEEA